MRLTTRRFSRIQPGRARNARRGGERSGGARFPGALLRDRRGGVSDRRPSRDADAWSPVEVRSGVVLRGWTRGAGHQNALTGAMAIAFAAALAGTVVGVPLSALGSPPPQAPDFAAPAEPGTRAEPGASLDLAASEPGGAPARTPRPARAFPLRFDSELIRLAVVGDSLEVDGSYYLACLAPIERPFALFYPFPRDSLLAGARMVGGVTRGRGRADLPLRFEGAPGRDGVRWWVPSCEGDTIEIRGVYRQGLRAKYARYIVTTTRAWMEPLRHARFEIRLPEGARPIAFSFPFAAARDSLGPLYIWETDDFYPDRDITVTWE